MPDRLEPTLKALKPDRFGYAQARHLLWRAGFGGTPTQVQTLVDWGPERSVDHLLDAEIPFRADAPDAFDAEIMRPPTDEERAQYRAALERRDENTLARFRAERQRRQVRDRAQMREIQSWWLTRLIESPRPLEEKMTLFWHGHFATGYRTIEDSYHMYAQNRLFRRYALGNFGDLLFRVIRDPAMLAYLDNNDSRKGQPNENLARELMELFTLGVGNYTERDIKEGARALTGYTFEHNRFVFREDDHDGGSKSILGTQGTLDGDGFVTAILGQRACSRFIAWKLYRFFVGRTPYAESERDPPVRRFIGELGDAMLASRYDMRPVLRHLLLSEHFYGPRVIGELIKSPAELVVGAVRSLHTPVRDLSILLDAMDLMGQDLFQPPSVKGWDGGRSWINTSTLYVRQNILSFLLTGRKPHGYDALASEERYDPGVLLNPLAAAEPGSDRDPKRAVDYLLRHTIGDAPDDARATLLAFVDEHGGTPTPEIITGVLLLISAMPEYQLC